MIEKVELKEMVDSAIKELAPYFGIDEETASKLKQPKITAVSERWSSAYDPSKNRIMISGEDIDDINEEEVIGEEVGHWYHTQLNPASTKIISANLSFSRKFNPKRIIKLFRDAFAVPDSRGSSIKFDEETEAFIRERQWQEYVGRYAALVLANKKGTQLKKKIRGPISFAASKLDAEYDEFRVRSYKYQPVAESDFIKYGPRLLSEIVNAKSLEEIGDIKASLDARL